MPEVAVRAVAMHAEQPHGWRKTRLLVVKLAGSGEWTSEEVAEVCGVSRGRVFVWLKTVRERGLEALLERGKTGPREGVCRGVQAKVIQALKAKLEAGEFTTAQAALRFAHRSGSLRLAVSLRSAPPARRRPAAARAGADHRSAPCTPELNPCEALWDIVKDDIANRIHASVTKLRIGMRATLQRFWEEARAVLSLVGRQWLHVELNASHGIKVSC